MKKYCWIQKSISVFLIFILFIQITGCYSSKIISKSELPLNDSINYTFKVHNKKSNYLLENATIVNDTLSGLIVSGKSALKNDKIIVYTSSDSILTINKENILKISSDNIKKVKIKEFSELKTMGLFIICIPVGIFTYTLIDIAINGFDIDFHLGG